MKNAFMKSNARRRLPSCKTSSAAAVLAVLAAWWGNNANAEAETNTPALAVPAIRFASNVYDFGKAVGDVLVNCVFTITNLGTATLEIANVVPSCSCMHTGDWTRRIEPGQTGTITVIYDTRLHIGPFDKWVTVDCNDPAQRKVTLTIKGTVWRAIEITPASASLLLCSEVTSNTATVKLISHEDAPLTLSDLQLVGVTANVELQTNVPGKEYQLVMRSPVPMPTNSQQGFIKLRTSSTNQPEVSIRAFVNVYPVLMAIPTQIKLPPLPLADAFFGKIWVRNNGTNVLALSDPVVNAPGVSVEIATNPAAMPPTEITAKFPAGFDAPAGKNLELRIKSADPLFPLLTVPILQAGGHRDASSPVAPK